MSAVIVNRKTLLFLWVSMFCFAAQGFSQDNRGKHSSKILFGHVPNGNGDVVIKGYDAVLSDPQFETKEAGWEVVEFKLSFQPKGKDYYGPYVTKGSKLTDKEIALFKYFRDEKLGRVQVFFEELSVREPDGLIRKLNGQITFTILDN